MPDFWQFPTVSMGLGPLMSIYQARFMRYLNARGFLKPAAGTARLGLRGRRRNRRAGNARRSITLAARENLDNLIWVVNCNLQRLDGPVRGNGKIIQELEGIFRGAGWNVIKVIWGSDWDELAGGGHFRPAGQTHGRGRGRRFPEIHRRRPAATSAAISSANIPELLPPGGSFDATIDLTRLVRGGHDPRQSLCRLQSRRRTQGRPDGHPGQDGQRLRPGRSRRGPQHFPSAEEDERKGAARIPRPLRRAHPR